jgi:flagellar hook-associated protein 3 FlgL
MVNSVSTLTSNLLIQQQIQQIQKQLDQTQIQITTGLKSNLFSDLGLGAQQSLDFNSVKSQVNAYQDSIHTAQSYMSVMDQSLTNITQIATDFQAEYIKDRNTIDTSPTTQALLQEKAKEALSEIEQTLNVQVQGRYVFSGRLATTAPLVPANSTAFGTAPLTVISNDINTTAGTNYVANGVATCFNQVITDLTPSAAAYTGTPPNTYPYNGDNAALSNTYPFTNALTVRADKNFTIGYTVRADNPAIAAILQGLYAMATTNLPAGASQATTNSYVGMLDAANFRVTQGLEGNGATAPAGVFSAAGPALGLRSVLGNLAFQETQLQDLDTQHQATLTAVTQNISNTQDADAAQAITNLQNLQNQLTSTFKVTASLQTLSLANYIT